MRGVLLVGGLKSPPPLAGVSGDGWSAEGGRPLGVAAAALDGDKDLRGASPKLCREEKRLSYFTFKEDNSIYVPEGLYL